MKGVTAPIESGPFAHAEWEAWLKWDGGDHVPSPTLGWHTSSFTMVAHPETSGASHSYQRQDTADMESLDSTSKDHEAEEEEDQDLSSSESSCPRAQPRNQKRKREVGMFAKVAGVKSPSVKKKSHNAVEKRYRTNLNDKITALRDSVPSLRRMSNTSTKDSMTGLSGNAEDFQVPAPPLPKLNKTTVLSKAIEYIQYLERCNRCLVEENSMLRNQRDGLIRHQHLDAAEISGPENGDLSGDDASAPFTQLRTTVKTSMNISTGPRGMISVPENISKLRIGSLQAHYADQACYRNSRTFPSRSSGPGEDTAGDPRQQSVSKLMVGTLAGLW